MQITTEILAFVSFIVSTVLSVIIYINRIDRRVTVLESKMIDKEEFYLKIEEVKEAISYKIESEIERCRDSICNNV